VSRLSAVLLSCWPVARPDRRRRQWLGVYCNRIYLYKSKAVCVVCGGGVAVARVWRGVAASHDAQWRSSSGEQRRAPL
jgi:hypothetical protein